MKTLTLSQWESLCEGAEEMLGGGAMWTEVMERYGSVAELEELRKRHGQWKAKALRRERLRVEIDLARLPAPVSARETEGIDEDSPVEEVLAVLRYMGGQRLVAQEWRWVPGGMHALKAGETWEVRDGEEGRWPCVTVLKAGKTVKEYDGCALRQVRPAGWMGVTHGALILKRREMTTEGLDREGILTRYAQVCALYFGKSTGIQSAAHLARLTGRTRAAAAAQQAGLAKDYYRKTGGRGEFEGVKSAARLKAGMTKPETRIHEGGSGAENLKGQKGA